MTARHAHRASGLHRPTRALALAPGLRDELERRGLLHEWEPVPADAPTAGQTLGGTGPYVRRSGAHRPTGRRPARNPVGPARTRRLLDQPAPPPGPPGLDRPMATRTRPRTLGGAARSPRGTGAQRRPHHHHRRHPPHGPDTHRRRPRSRLRDSSCPAPPSVPQWRPGRHQTPHRPGKRLQRRSPRE